MDPHRNGRNDQLCARHRFNGNRRLRIFGHCFSTGVDRGWLDAARSPFIHPLLGHAFIYHAAGSIRRFAAASIAGANPVATGFEAMRMGIAIYWVPFLFVVNPSLIGFGPWQQIALSVFEAVLGILAIAWAAQRFLPRIGRLSYWAAGLLGFGGLLVSLPTLELEGLHCLTLWGMFWVLG